MRAKHALIIAALTLGVWGTVRAEEAKTEKTKPASTYPLTTCVVSGDGLTEMGDPVKYTYKAPNGTEREIQFCCTKCIKKFEKDPAKYLKVLDAAEAKAKAAPKTEAPK